MPAFIFNRLHDEPSKDRVTVFQVIRNGEPVGVLRSTMLGNPPPQTPRGWVVQRYDYPEPQHLPGKMSESEAMDYLRVHDESWMAEEKDLFRLYAHTRYGFRFVLHDGLLGSAAFMVDSKAASTVLEEHRVIDAAMDAFHTDMPLEAIPGDWITRISAVSVHTGNLCAKARPQRQSTAHWLPEQRLTRNHANEEHDWKRTASSRRKPEGLH